MAQKPSMMEWNDSVSKGIGIALGKIRNVIL